MEDHVPSRHGRHPLRWLSDVWRSACRPVVFRSCGTIALVVGMLLSAVNQGDAIVGGRFDRALVLKIVANYLIPFLASNLGAMTTMPAESSEHEPHLRNRAGRGGPT